MVEKHFNIKQVKWSVLGLITIVFSFFLYSSLVKNDYRAEDLKGFQQVYNKKEEKLKEATSSVLKSFLNANQNEKFYAINQETSSLSQKGYSFFVYVNNELKAWTGNQLSTPLKLNEPKKQDKVVLLKNGWYREFSLKKDSIYILGTFLIKNEFPYENKDLVNDFHEEFSFPYFAQIEKSTQPEFTIQGSNKASSFSLIPTEKKPPGHLIEILTILLLLLGVFLLIYPFISSVSKWARFVTVLLLFLLRYYQLSADLFLFEDMTIFQPDIFASSEWYPSLGDLIINTFVIVLVIIGLVSLIRIKGNEQNSLKWIYLFFISAILVFWGIYTNVTINNLIENSNINFRLDEFFQLTALSFTGLLLVGIHFFLFVYLTNKWIQAVQKLLLPLNRTLLVVFLLLALSLLSVQNALQFYEVLWPFLMMITVGWMHARYSGNTNFTGILLLLLVVSGYTSFLISHLNTEKEKKNRIAYAERLITDEDPLTEIEYDRIGKKIEQSPFLRKLYFDSLFLSKSEIDSKVENLFFSKFWEKYELNFNYFDRDSLPADIRINKSKTEFERLDKLKRNKGVPSKINSNIYFIPDFSQQINYMISQSVKFQDSLIGYFYVTLRSKKIPEQIGFPKLMLDKNTKTIEELSNYSVSRYTSGDLVTRYGDYNYPLNDSIWKLVTGSPSVFYTYEGYSHLIYKINKQSLAVISKPKNSLYQGVTSFSYIFTYFGLLLLMYYAVLYIPQGINISSFSLNSKIQFFSISLVILTLITFVYGSSIFLRDQYYDKSVRQFKEKVNSVEMEVRSKLDKEEEFTPYLKNYTEEILQKFASVFNTDINLYDPKGKLFASSRPKMFSVGLLAPVMNPQAYQSVIWERKSEFIHSESIGRLQYLSAYAPLLNEEDQLLGYINLQYFSRQNELEEELASLIVAIVNIFVLLFAVSVISTIFVSNWMTKPIKLISKSLKRIELGRKNETIEYSGNDEIADLVKEYNQKVKELEKNAEQLAKSERESAWREMAKQVAHEIKNPLTPMKLSIQHLQRSFDPNDPEANEKIDKITQSLVEQIDGLTHIANAFSNFAKLPQPENEDVDLILLLENCKELHQNKAEVSIQLLSELRKAVIHVDKNLMTRVFNNLIINAIQAVPKDQKGEVIIKVQEEHPYYTVSIEDNGSGVSDEVKDKIFSPNFTTKSTGTGLGLAMVKNIVESYKGQVRFESKANEGSAFYVSLLKDG